MSSAQSHGSPPTLTEKSEVYDGDQQTQQADPVEQNQRKSTEPESQSQPGTQPKLQPRSPPEPQSVPEPEPEPQPEHEPRLEVEQIASSSHSQVLDHPPRIPPKDRDSEGRLSVLISPRFSQVVDWNTTAQPSFTAAAHLMTHSMNRSDDPETPTMTRARSLVNQPITVENGGNGYNANAEATRSTPNVLNRTAATERRNSSMVDSTTVNREVIRPVPASTSSTPANPNRSQNHLPPSRPLSSIERRATGPGLISYDPIRGGDALQVSYLPDSNGYDGGGDYDGGANRSTSRRATVARPISATNPTDGTIVENGPGTWSGSRRASRLMSGQDWLVGVPVVEQPPKRKTLEDRLKPTVESATAERNKVQKRASQQSILINGAIALQVIAGALTTGVAASGSRNIGTAVAALGGLSTILASYLAKVRGSGEPELSTVRTRELNSFLREVETFIMDHGDKTGEDYDEQVSSFRERFEMIIKTDAEGSGGGTFFHPQPPTQLPPPHAVPPAVHPANGNSGTMPGAYNPHGVDEKQYMCKTCKDEKKIRAVA